MNLRYYEIAVICDFQLLNDFLGESWQHFGNATKICQEMKKLKIEMAAIDPLILHQLISIMKLY